MSLGLENEETIGYIPHILGLGQDRVGRLFCSIFSRTRHEVVQSLHGILVVRSGELAVSRGVAKLMRGRRRVARARRDEFMLASCQDGRWLVVLELRFEMR